jgi:hypothetical protein
MDSPPASPAPSAPAAAASGKAKAAADAPSAAVAKARSRPVTSAAKALQELREKRVAQRKVLLDLRKETKRQKRKVKALNQKAAKLTVAEICEITHLKWATLVEKGELPDDMPSGASSSADATTHVMTTVAKHVAEKSAHPSDI